MTTSALLTVLVTDPDGGLYVDFERSELLRPGVTIRVQVGSYDVVALPAHVGGDMQYIEPFEDGQQYSVTLTVILTDGSAGPPTTVVLTAWGMDGWGMDGWAGYSKGEFGSAVPSSLLVPEEAAQPTPTASVAYVVYENTEDSMPVHPSVTYDPAFSPDVPEGSAIYWVYFLSASGEDALRLVVLPEALWSVDLWGEPLDRDARVWLGPDGAVYYLDTTQVPISNGSQLYDVSVRLKRAATTQYGVPPPTASEVAAYELSSVLPVRAVSLVWVDDEPTLVVAHFGYYNQDEDRVVVLTEGGATVNLWSSIDEGGDRPSPKIMVGTTTGVFMVEAGEPV